MFLEEVKKELLDLFIEHKDFTPTAQSALNVACYLLIKNPSFNDAYQHFHLHQAGPELLIMSFKKYGKHLKSNNVVEPAYANEDDYGWEWMDDEQIKNAEDYIKNAPPRPTYFNYHDYEEGQKRYNQDEIFDSMIPQPVLDKAWFFLQELSNKNEKVADILLSEQPLEGLKNIQYQWLNPDEMSLFLESHYKPQVYPLGNLYSAGLDYFKMDYSNDNFERQYLLVTNDFAPIGVACITLREKEKQLYLSYLSVAPGYRNQGISRQIFQKSMDLAKDKNYFFARSSPGEFARNNSGITLGYDKIVAQNNWLVVGADDYSRQFIVTKLVEKNSNIQQWQEEFLKHYPNNVRFTEKETLESVLNKMGGALAPSPKTSEKLSPVT